MNVFDLSARIGLDTKDFTSGISKAGSLLKSGFSAAVKVGTVAVTAATTAITVFTKKTIDATSEVAQYGDNIDKMSQKLGISAEAYQEWDAIMQHSGASIDSLQSSMKTMATAAEKGSDAFERLGISEKDVANLSQEDLFARVIAGLQEMGEGTERTYIASQLLGRGATELGALLNTSAEDTEAMRQAVHDLGGVMSNEAVKAAAEYQDTLQDMQTAFSGLKRSIYSEFMPVITTAMGGLAKIFSGNSDEGIAQLSDGITKFVNNIVDSAPEVMSLVGEIISAVGEAVIINLPSMLDAGMRLLDALGQGIVDNLDTILDAGGQIIDKIITAITDENNLSSFLKTTLKIVTAIGDAILTNLPALGDAGLGLIVQLGQYLVDNAPEMNSALLDFVKNIGQMITDNLPELFKTAAELVLTLATGIGNALPELIPTIVDIILQIVETLTNPESIGNLVDAAIAILLGLTDGIINAIPILLEAAPEIITNLVTALVENIPKLIDAAIEIIFALFDALTDPENILLIIKAAIQIVAAITKGILTLITDIPGIVLKIVTKLVDGFGEKFYKIVNIGKDVVNKVKEGFMEKVEQAKNWGKDLISNFTSGITEKWEKLKGTVSNIANGIKDFLGFSEPRLGPLSDFHTYAPDMMELFAKGIRDNEDVVTNQLARSFDFGNLMSASSLVPAQGSGSLISSGSNSTSQGVAYLEIDREKFAKLIYNLNASETQRVGVKLVNA